MFALAFGQLLENSDDAIKTTIKTTTKIEKDCTKIIITLTTT